MEQCGLGKKRFEQVDLQLLQDFEAYMTRKGNSSNSLATSFSVLRAVYNKAVKQKVFAETDNPFKQYNIGKFWKPTRKRAITKEDVQNIQSLELPKSTESYSLVFARDMFLFSYYVAGLKVNLTTYVARHTFATVLKRSGVNIAIISESLGHSDFETTQIYLDSFENSQIDEAMKNLL